MADETVRVEIDRREVTGEYESMVFAMPRLVYEEDNGVSVRRFLGPAGFQITLHNPSGRLLALVDGGASVHRVTISASGQSISHATEFRDQWVTADGVCKMFGCLASAQDGEAKWVNEPQLADA